MKAKTKASLRTAAVATVTAAALGVTVMLSYESDLHVKETAALQQIRMRQEVLLTRTYQKIDRQLDKNIATHREILRVLSPEIELYDRNTGFKDIPPLESK